MKKKFIALIIVAVLISLGVAYWLISPLFITTELHESAPEELVMQEGVSENTTNKSMQKIVTEVQGPFQNSAHEVSGTARIIKQEEGKVLRFENFETLNGPDLFIYLATDEKATEFVSLGAIKATKGNINYDIPPEVDTNKYNHAIVWCRAFSVNFGYAVLS